MVTVGDDSGFDGVIVTSQRPSGVSLSVDHSSVVSNTRRNG